MRVRNLFEEQQLSTIVFTFGRFNPPTIGHEILINKVKQVAEQFQAEYIIFSSQSQDKKKNPLSYAEKIFFMEQMFPGTNFNKNTSIKTPFQALEELGKKYDRAVLVVGSDRVPEFKTRMAPYVEEFGYKDLVVVSAGERDPDADDASGMSASKARELAIAGDLDQFKQAIPGNNKLAEMMYNKVRSGLGIVNTEPVMAEGSIGSAINFPGYGNDKKDSKKNKNKEKKKGIVDKIKSAVGLGESEMDKATLAYLQGIDTSSSLWKKSKKGKIQSDEIENMQFVLKSLGYNPGPIDGWFGKKTADAVRQFQKDNDLTVDGDPGKNTIGAMIDAVSVNVFGDPEDDIEATYLDKDGNDTGIPATLGKSGGADYELDKLIHTAKTAIGEEKDLDPITLQRILKFANDRDRYNSGTGDAVMSTKGTEELIARARAQAKRERIKNTKAHAHRKDGVHKQGFKQVKFDPVELDPEIFNDSYTNEGSLRMPTSHLRGMIIQMLQDMETKQDTATLVKVARLLGKEVYFTKQGSQVVLQDPDFDFYAKENIDKLVKLYTERSLTKDEEKDKEKYVKGMKKNKKDFKKRYGDDAEAVMYATATKMAKEDAVNELKGDHDRMAIADAEFNKIVATLADAGIPLTKELNQWRREGGLVNVIRNLVPFINKKFEKLQSYDIDRYFKSADFNSKTPAEKKKLVPALLNIKKAQEIIPEIVLQLRTIQKDLEAAGITEKVQTALPKKIKISKMPAPPKAPTADTPDGTNDDGVRIKTTAKGNRSVSSGAGTYIFSPQGKLMLYMTPKIGGLQQTHNLTKKTVTVNFDTTVKGDGDVNVGQKGTYDMQGNLISADNTNMSSGGFGIDLDKEKGQTINYRVSDKMKVSANSKTGLSVGEEKDDGLLAKLKGIFDFSGSEMEDEYIPFVTKNLRRYGDRRTKELLKKEFPDIKPTDVEKAMRMGMDIIFKRG